MEFNTIKHLYNLKENYGFSENIIQSACKKWGALPNVLQEYYRQLGTNKRLNHVQNHLCEPEHLIDAGDYLIFYKENQYVLQWAIKKEDLTKENPPVYIAEDERSFKLESKTLDYFLNAMAYFQAVFSLDYSCEEFYIVKEETAEKIKKRFKKKPYELYQGFPSRFYGNHEDEIIYLGENGNEYDMLYASSNAKHFKQIKEFIDRLEIETY